MAGAALQWAGLLASAAGLAVLLASFRPRVRRFWPFGAAILCAGCFALAAGDLISRDALGWAELFMASVLLGIIARVASTAPGVR